MNGLTLSTTSTRYNAQSGWIRLTQGFTHCQVVVPCRLSSQHWAWSVRDADRVVNREQVYLYLPQAKIPEKATTKSVAICWMTNDVETSRLNSYIRPHSLHPIGDDVCAILVSRRLV